MLIAAVSYPARSLGVKRGDRWPEIRKKAPGVVGIHVETGVLFDAQGSTEEGEGIDNREAKYRAQFNMSKEEKREKLGKENGFIPDRSRGKASLER